MITESHPVNLLRDQECPGCRPGGRAVADPSGEPDGGRCASAAGGCDDGPVTPRDLPPSVPVTALRVFEPLEAFPPAQRRPLTAFAADPAAGRRAEEVERRAAWRRLLGRPDGVRAGEVVARVLRVEGVVLVCPVSGEPPGAGRFLPGVVTGPDAYAAAGPDPDGAAGTSGAGGTGAAGVTPSAGLAPGGTAGTAAGPAPESGGARPGPTSGGPTSGGAPGGVPPRRHTLVRSWELPVAWLAIVRREDLTASGGPARYVMPMSRARARAARALRTFRAHLGELDVTADAEGLARWLESFHPRSWVEIDARPVAALVGGDDGAEDVRLGLDSLTAGEAAAVAAAYQRLRRRSRRLEELSLSS